MNFYLYSFEFEGVHERERESDGEEKIAMSTMKKTKIMSKKELSRRSEMKQVTEFK